MERTLWFGNALGKVNVSGTDVVVGYESVTHSPDGQPEDEGWKVMFDNAQFLLDVPCSGNWRAFFSNYQKDHVTSLSLHLVDSTVFTFRSEEEDSCAC